MWRSAGRSSRGNSLRSLRLGHHWRSGRLSAGSAPSGELHTCAAQRPCRDRSRVLRGDRRGSRASRGIEETSSPGRGAVRDRPPRLHPSSAGPADPLLPLPPGVPGDVRPGRRPVPGNAPAGERLPARCGGAGRFHLPAGPRVHRAGAGDGRRVLKQHRRRVGPHFAADFLYACAVTRAPSRLSEELVYGRPRSSAFLSRRRLHGAASCPEEEPRRGGATGGRRAGQETAEPPPSEGDSARGIATCRRTRNRVDRPAP